MLLTERSRYAIIKQRRTLLCCALPFGKASASHSGRQCVIAVLSRSASHRTAAAVGLRLRLHRNRHACTRTADFRSMANRPLRLAAAVQLSPAGDATRLQHAVVWLQQGTVVCS